MKNKNLILIIVIILLLLVIVAGIVTYVVVLSKQNTPKPTEITIPTDVVEFEFEEPFINNVNNSAKMSKIVIKMEIDKALDPLIKSKQADLRDKINFLMRGKTAEDLAEPEAQNKIKEEIKDIIKKTLKTEKTVEVSIWEILMQ